MCQKAHRQRDRQTKAHSFLPPPLSHLFGFVLFFRHSAVLLFSLRDETQDTTLCCLSAFNICMPLPHLPHTSFSSSADFFSPHLPRSLFLSPLCPIFFNLSCILFTLLFFYLTLSLCATLLLLSLALSFSFLVFSPLFCSVRPQHDLNVFLPSAAASL